MQYQIRAILRDEIRDFQSSPPPKERCNEAMHVAGLDVDVFQSSPPPKERCNGAATPKSVPQVCFQSSPPPKERCNVTDDPHPPAATTLSILTAPEGAVQYRVAVPVGGGGIFQSSPPPKERCNPERSVWHVTPSGPFNPHRPRRSGAMAYHRTG